MQRGQGQALSSGAQCQDKRPWAQTGAQEVPSEHQEHFCAVQVTEHLYRLPRGCRISSLEIFKGCLDVVLGTQLWASLRLEHMDPEVPANLSHSVVL